MGIHIFQTWCHFMDVCRKNSVSDVIMMAIIWAEKVTVFLHDQQSTYPLEENNILHKLVVSLWMF